MKLGDAPKSKGNIIRFLALLIILGLLAPKLFMACYSLYQLIFSNQDKVPSGNPMKVERPVPPEQVKPALKFEL